MRCPRCWTENRPYGRFCSQCGAPLEPEAAGSGRGTARPGQDAAAPAAPRSRSFLRGPLGRPSLAAFLAGPRGAPAVAAFALVSRGSRHFGKFQIQRLLGEGGMGVVYEALDPYIGRKVALKTLRMDGGTSSKRSRNLEQRLAREAQAAGRLLHPNIVVVYEAGELDGQGYIVMELVEGGTLADLLAEHERLEPPQAVAIALQVAEALGYAHEQQILHRDVKPSNVLLVKPRELRSAAPVASAASPGALPAAKTRPLPGAMQVKLTDFGLAKMAAERAITDEGTAVGTVAYMSPEQLAGRAVDGRADLYSLAVVLYECLSGERPFRAENLHGLMYRILEGPHQPLAEPLAGPRGEWTTFFDRALAKDPAARFPDAAAFAAELERLPPLATSGGSETLSMARVPPDSASLQTLSLEATPVPREPPPARRSVAVLGFKNLAARPDAAWLSTALGEMLGTELAAGEQLRTIPGESVARARIELGLAETDSFGRETLERIRRNLGTDLVVLGSYLALGQKLRLDVRLQDTLAGETLCSVAEAGTDEDLFDLVTRVGARLRERLGVGQRPSVEAEAVRGSLPRSAEAARLYSEGLDRLRLFDLQGALERLEQAAAAEPAFPLTRWALAEVWRSLGHGARAQAAAARAFELAAGLPQAERLAIEARHREALHEWDQAIEIHAMLWRFFPDEPEHGLRLAAAQTSTGRGRDALQTVDRLRALPAPLGEDPRIDLCEARAASLTSDSQRMLAAAGRAALKGHAQGASLLVAAARLQESLALHRLGRLEEATGACAEAHRLFEAAGDQIHVVAALFTLGLIHRDREELAEAWRTFEEARSVSRAVGHAEGMADTALQLGAMLGNQGQYEAACALFVEARDNFLAIGARTRVAETTSELAKLALAEGRHDVAFELHRASIEMAHASGEKHLVAMLILRFATRLLAWGLPDSAQRLLDEGLGLAREIGAQGLQGRALLLLADLHRVCGNLDLADEALLEVQQLARRTGNSNSLAAALLEHGHVLLERARFTDARELYHEARAIRRTVGRESLVPLALLRLLLEEGRSAEAETRAQELAREFREGGWAVDELGALSALARALLAQDRPLPAMELLERIETLGSRTWFRLYRLEAGVLAVRIRGAAGGLPGTLAAIDTLETLLAELQGAGLYLLALEGRLALGELELLAGRPEAGRKRLAELHDEARTRGYERIARRAQRAAGAASPRAADAPGLESESAGKP